MLLTTATKTCSLYKEVVIDANDQIESEYGGSTTQRPSTRDKQHRGNSCNKGLREALEQGKRVEFQIIDTFQYVDENDRKRKERDLILGIAESKRLNV